ncbi:formyl-CoA transferase [Sphingomonas kaistensis]|uniref:Formyl-CoA transferase n=1 Tax=Sphingomonas kaistensis TaxID=298708 RepID=A0A7X5Y845_9SPHN|nr:CaiB/BaiF CoA-transferase family protein [Sphingomonas kaistensis]NJC06914.1 formyl-CoA transferase [Sphingomonas kaistensis]
MTKPLAGIRVLDLSRVLAGPWCTQLLADLGADVIKIERPGVGDDTRLWGPPWVEHENGTRTAAYFLAANRGKRSAAIDLASDEGADQIRRIADRSDVVVENFKVGALARYGLDAATLRARNPRLVYASITGFGQDGPRARQAGYDFMIQGQAGLMSITGLPDEVDGGGPLRAGVAIVDLFTGLYTANAILAALVGRATTGQGASIDSALFDCGLAMLANQASNYLVSGEAPPRQGNTHPNLVPYQPFACADQPLIVAVGNDRQFASLAAILCHPEWATDPRFATNAARIAHRAVLVPSIEAIMRASPAAYWYEACERAGIPAGPINSIANALADPQATHRAMLREMDGMRLLGSPVRLSGHRMDSDRPPPRLGQHTAEILAELG